MGLKLCRKACAGGAIGAWLLRASTASAAVWQSKWGMLTQAPNSLKAYGVKERLRTRWAEAHAGERGGAAFAPLRNGDFAGGRQRTLFALLNSYRDVLLPAYPYPTKCVYTGTACTPAPAWHWHTGLAVNKLLDDSKCVSETAAICSLRELADISDVWIAGLVQLATQQRCVLTSISRRCEAGIADKYRLCR